MATGGSHWVEEEVISQEMERHGIDPKDIPDDLHVDPSNVSQVMKSGRYFKCKAFARLCT